jgi:hypothetical protein
MPHRLDAIPGAVLSRCRHMVEHGRRPRAVVTSEPHAAKWSFIADSNRGVIGTQRPFPLFVRCPSRPLAIQRKPPSRSMSDHWSRRASDTAALVGSLEADLRTENAPQYASQLLHVSAIQRHV